MPPRSRPASSAAELDGLTRAVFAALGRRLDGAGPFALALSGGGDSVALLHIAAAWAARRGRALIALTVDHGLNPDSARWTAEAGEAARAVGARWLALPWTGEKPSSGLPAAARTARHALLAEAARGAGARVILTGHTLDDLLEGELIRAETPTLGRPSDWSPSPAWPEGRGVFLCRPLLELRRAELRSWLSERRIPWLDDPANEDERYARARARKELKLSPHRGDGRSPEEGLKGVAANDSALQPPPPFPGGGGTISLDRSIDARTLSAALLCAAGTAIPPRSKPVAALLDRLKSGERFTATLAGALLDATGDGILLGREPGRAGLPTVSTRPGETFVWDGRFELLAEGAAVVPLAGRLARLSKPERAEIAELPGWARPTLPAHVLPDGAVKLARGVPLSLPRLRAALGFVKQESDI